MKKQAICDSSYKVNTHPWSSIFRDTIFYAFVEIQMAVLKNKQTKKPKKINQNNKKTPNKTFSLQHLFWIYFLYYTKQSSTESWRPPISSSPT